MVLEDRMEYGKGFVDPDLPAHLMCVRKRGVCLYGKPVDEVFGEVDWQDFMRSVLADLTGSLRTRIYVGRRITAYLTSAGSRSCFRKTAGRCSASMKADHGGSGTFRRSIRRLLKRPWKYTVVTGRSAKPKGKSAASRGTGRSCLLSAIMRGQWQRTGVRDLPQMSRGMTIHRMELDAKCR